jgi:hypothetical protein
MSLLVCMVQGFVAALCWEWNGNKTSISKGQGGRKTEGLMGLWRLVFEDGKAGALSFQIGFNYQ